MRLITCDRCGIDKGPFAQLQTERELDLCPACVERALEKPERDPVLAATDLPDVPMVLGDHDTLNQLLCGDVVIDASPVSYGRGDT